MPQPLRVSETSLAASAAACAGYAEQLVVAGAAPRPGASCQPSTSAIEGALCDAAAARVVMAGRIRVSAAALGEAAGAYADADSQGAANLGKQLAR